MFEVIDELNMQSITIKGEELELLPEKAIFWERKKMLLISDLHIGKSAHFQKAGIPISSKIHEDDLLRLSEILRKFSVQTICIIGDLFHSAHNHEWEQFYQWRLQYPDVRIILVKGNHDLSDEEKILAHGIDEICNTKNETPFSFIHDINDQKENNLYSISGHLHPAIRLTGKGKQSLKFPCFWFSKNNCVLPSYGNFTGNAIIQPENGDEVYMVINNSVVKLSN